MLPSSPPPPLVNSRLILPTGPVDIAAVIDEVVKEWKARNPDLRPAEIDKILASAEKAKASFLTPAARLSVDSDPTLDPTASNVVESVPRHRRKIASLIMGANSTIAEARAIVRQAQQEANARNRERFDNPLVNTYWAHLDSRAALRARAEDVASFAVNETVAVAAVIVAEADSAHNTPTELPSIPPDILESQESKSSYIYIYILRPRERHAVRTGDLADCLGRGRADSLDRCD